MMSLLYLYVVAGSKRPDRITCGVPFEVDDETIFFGPCLKKLRESLRKRYINDESSVEPCEVIYVIGFGKANPSKTRWILWCGKITRIMTFEAAYISLTDNAFKKMRSLEMSPLHVKPLYDKRRRLIGYERISDYHKKNDNWIEDLVMIRDDPHIILNGTRLLLKAGMDRNQVFKRDCCFLCENIFFARSMGIPVTDEMVGILRTSQPNARGIDRYAIFGLDRNDNIKPRRGLPLGISGEPADDLIKLVTGSRIEQGPDTGEIIYSGCRCN